MRFDRARLFPPDLDAYARDRRARALDLMEAALAAVDPYACTRRAIEQLEGLDGATLFAFGKAAGEMARAACDVLDVHGGVAVVLEPVELPIEVRVASHPVPANDAEATGAAVLARAEALGERGHALCLVSGGGSAMLELPKRGVSLDTIASVSRALMRAGANIGELNEVRRALSRLKGGGLARAIAPASISNVVISDVPGHGPEVVASGPTCAAPGPHANADAPGSPRTVERARAVLERYGLWRSLDPVAQARVLEPPPELETAIRTVVAADNTSARAAVRARGVRDRPGFFAGEARELGARFAREGGEGAWIWGGESTVTVTGPGRGGRNQELLLGALGAGWSRGLLLAFGTDGIDGTSDAGGALIDPAAVQACASLGLDPARALAENDSHAFFEALGTQLRSGRTGTNVADLCLYLP